MVICLSAYINLLALFLFRDDVTMTQRQKPLIYALLLKHFYTPLKKVKILRLFV